MIFAAERTWIGTFGPGQVPTAPVGTVSLPPMLDVGRLRVLLAISEHGELPAAARALGTPVGDAAAQVSGLERELGLPLAEGDRLTPAGRRLAGHAGRLLAQLEAAESDAAAVAGRAAGVLRLGIGAAAGRALLPDALATLRGSAPELDLRVQQLADERADTLGTGRLDVVVVGEFAAAVPRRTDPDVERRELLTEPLLVAVPARHRATGASVRLAELADERWVGGPVGGDALTALERAAAAAGFEPRLVGHAAEDGLALALVAAGVGVALVPASSVPVPVEGVRFLTAVDAGLRRTVTAVVRRSAAADPAVLRLLDALGQAARRVAAAVTGVTASAAPTPRPGPPVPPVAPAREPFGSGADPRAAGGRRPDPLFDPLPPGERGGEVPRQRPRAADPWADRTGPADLPEPRRDGVLEPQANGYANGTGGSGLEAYRSDPYRSETPRPEPPPRPEGYGGGRTGPGGAGGAAQRPAGRGRPPGLRREPAAGPEPPRRRRNTGPLPPPGLPADRPRAAAPEPPGPALGPPPGPAPASPTGPLPTSPDLGVRSLSAGDLPGRRPARPAHPVARPPAARTPSAPAPPRPGGAGRAATTARARCRRPRPAVPRTSGCRSSRTCSRSGSPGATTRRRRRPGRPPPTTAGGPPPGWPSRPPPAPPRPGCPAAGRRRCTCPARPAARPSTRAARRTGRPPGRRRTSAAGCPATGTASAAAGTPSPRRTDPGGTGRSATSGQPGHPAAQRRVADEGDHVEQRVRDDQRHHPPGAQEEPAEQDAHHRVADERAEALVEVVGAAQQRGRADRVAARRQPAAAAG